MSRDQRTNSPCIACDAPMYDGLAPWHLLCRSCGYESAELEPTINDNIVHQQVNEAERERGLKGVRVQNFRIIINLIREHSSPQQRTLLDVGSAHGWFLDEARATFQVQGIEPDDKVRQAALAKGLPVRAGYFPSALASDERFDVIVFNDVIEHIPDISAALRACHDRLREDGLLVLNLPNSKGMFYRLSRLFARFGWNGPFGRLWQIGLPSPHVHYFHSANLGALVARHGFVSQATTHIAAVRAKGLWERLACARPEGGVGLYLQFAGVLCLLPVLFLSESDIVVCVFKREHTAAIP